MGSKMRLVTGILAAGAVAASLVACGGNRESNAVRPDDVVRSAKPEEVDGGIELDGGWEYETGEPETLMTTAEEKAFAEAIGQSTNAEGMIPIPVALLAEKQDDAGNTQRMAYLVQETGTSGISWGVMTIDPAGAEPPQLLHIDPASPHVTPEWEGVGDLAADGWVQRDGVATGASGELAGFGKTIGDYLAALGHNDPDLIQRIALTNSEDARDDMYAVATTGNDGKPVWLLVHVVEDSVTGETSVAQATSGHMDLTSYIAE